MCDQCAEIDFDIDGRGGGPAKGSRLRYPLVPGLTEPGEAVHDGQVQRAYYFASRARLGPRLTDLYEVGSSFYRGAISLKSLTLPAAQLK